MILRYPDSIRIYAQGDASDAAVGTRLENDRLYVRLTAQKSEPRFIRLRWIFTEEERRNEPVKVMGDAWERGYGDMEWRGIVPERCMPWVCMVSNGSDADDSTEGRRTECFGVRVRPGALCFWQYDPAGVTLWCDVRNGGCGVRLNGRELEVCTVVFGDYRDMTAFHAVRQYYGTLCDDALTAPFKVYGSNNWYYAYGKSSHAEILQDAKLVSEFCEGLENRPFMVIDDGWEPNDCDAPWIGGDCFPDMKGLAEAIEAVGARPGIWIRYLIDGHHAFSDAASGTRLARDPRYLDPSHPDVLAYVRRDTERIAREWGYKLIKHDYSTFDIFGDWGFNRPVTLTDDGWHFYDRSKTSAEIVTGFYRAIREAAGKDTVLIGCNVIGHLAAGLVEVNRTGDDTSGREWERTRKYGVNTLAFRMMHDKNFYAADADCAAVTEAVDAHHTAEWLKALSVSGTPLFISCKPSVPDAAMKALIRQAYARNSVQTDTLEPVDWMETVNPVRWRLNGEAIAFDWHAPEGSERFIP